MSDIYDKAYVVAVDMGYGHQRAVFPLLDIATTPTSWNIGKPIVISANEYPDIPKIDRIKWFYTRKLYETISRVQGFPILGKKIFNLMSYVQRIEPFYPRRDLSKPVFPLTSLYTMIRAGFGKHLIDTLNLNPLPFITSFPIPAFCAEEHGYKGQIFCLCTDTDVARSWAPLDPSKSRITYLAPTLRVQERLKQYGVRPEMIIVTGFPLPKEAIGDQTTQDILLNSLKRRLIKLDPKGTYHKKYEKLLSLYLGPPLPATSPETPLNITFAIGGAGAQSDIALKLLNSFTRDIIDGRIRLNLVAGTSKTILEKFEKAIHESSLEPYLDSRIKIIYHPLKSEYFAEFNSILAETDILWTKPSELSFYVGLGLPIIMSPTIGSQEECNESWLHMMGAGFSQYDPRYAHEWLFDWIDSGWLAEAAMNGFLNASKRGSEHIANIMLHGKRTEIEDVHFV